MLALAEVAWTQKERKDLNDMTNNRLPLHLRMLEKRGYNFRVPDLLPYEEKPTVVYAFPELWPTVKDGKIYYNLDGHTPGETDQQYKNGATVTAPDGRELDFKALIVTPGGKRSLSTSLKYRVKK
jgi:hexosaminidase